MARPYLTRGSPLLDAWLRRATNKGGAVRPMSFVAPPLYANHAYTFPAVANPERLRAPDVQRAASPNARCVLRSDLLSLNSSPSIQFPFDLNRQFFRPLHTPYLSHGSPLLVAWLRRATDVLCGSATCGQLRPHLPSGG
jgi:hypothetical protein